MRYYWIKGMRYVYKNVDENGNIVGVATKMPLYLKKYPYYKICFKPPDQSEAVIQSETAIPEAEEITLEQAQQLADMWASMAEPMEIPIKDDKGNLIIGEDGRIKTIIGAKVPEKIASYDTQDIKDEMNRLYKLYGEHNG